MRIVPAALIGVSLFLGGCQGKNIKEQNDKLTPEELPTKVRESLNREADISPEYVNRHEFKGNVVYEATVQSEGKTWEIELDNEGRLLRRQQQPKND